MKIKKLINRIVAVMACVMISVYVNAQDKTLIRNINLNGTNRDTANRINSGELQTDHQNESQPINNTGKQEQTNPGKQGSAPADFTTGATSKRLNRDMQDSSRMHRTPVTSSRRDSTQPMNSMPKQKPLKKAVSSKNKNVYLVPDSTLKK